MSLWSKSEPELLRLSFALAAGGALALALCWMLGWTRLSVFGPALVFNAGVIAIAWGGSLLLARSGLAPRIVDALFYPLLFGVCMLVFAHAWCFDVAVERRLTLLDMTLDGTFYFFAHVLPARGHLALLALVAGLSTAAFLLSRKLAALTRHATVLLLLSPLLAAAWVLRGPAIASPLYDSAYELWELASLPKIAPARAAVPAQLLGVLDKSERTRASGSPRYSKVIVLVMETMTAESFERESAALSPDTFVRRERPRTHRFERYFPNNQDSRTGMLDMLFSRLIPFEAYSDEGHAGYHALSAQRSLVDELRGLSYASAFAVSQTTLEEVVDELSWDETLRLSEAQVSAALAQRRLCFTPDEYERSCEDLVLLPQVVDFVTRHERAFVYQEFIWGHAYEYNAASGRTNADYYSSYVDALLRELQTRGLTEQTLIVLTSDHGFRGRDRQDELEVYRVPLLLHAADASFRSDTRLLSHSDLGTLIFEQLTPGGARADDNPFVMIVGPTGQGNLFIVGREGGELLLRHKLGLDLVIAQRGRWPLPATALLALFNDYRARFVSSLRDRSVAR